MRINVHAGHNPKGKIACGVSDYLDESNQNRKVAKEVIRLLRRKGHTVYNCTVNNGTSQYDVLRKIVAKCNVHKVNLDISIHFNAGRRDHRGDGETGGVEAYTLKSGTFAYQVSKSICKEIGGLGFKNRGAKTASSLYFINHTKAPAILVECCFVDDIDDYKLYKRGNYKAMAKAIVNGILKYH